MVERGDPEATPPHLRLTELAELPFIRYCLFRYRKFYYLPETNAMFLVKMAEDARPRWFVLFLTIVFALRKVEIVLVASGEAR